MEPFFPFVLLGLAVGLLISGVSNLSVEGKYTKLFATSATAVGVAVLGWFFTTYGKGGPLYAVFSGLLLVGLLIWGLINPVVGRRLARNFAVIAMGLGTALLAWGISGAVSGERLRPPFSSNITTSSRKSAKRSVGGRVPHGRHRRPCALIPWENQEGRSSRSSIVNLRSDVEKVHPGRDIEKEARRRHPFRSLADARKRRQPFLLKPRDSTQG